MVNDDSPAFHPDLTRARFMPPSSATRGNRALLRFVSGLGRTKPPTDGELVDLGDDVLLRVHRPTSASAADAGARRPAVLHLHGGGLIIGAASGEANFKRIEPFFVDLFRGVLVLFLLEMGMTAGRHLKEFAKVGGRMLAFGIIMPMLNGFIITGLATFAGLPMGSAFVLGAVAASASYIDAPAAVRATFPEANPSIYLTASLGITFPFMVLAGVPIVWQMARFWQGL